jgi:hypothetical protein
MGLAVRDSGVPSLAIIDIQDRLAAAMSKKIRSAGNKWKPRVYDPPVKKAIAFRY